MTVGNGCFQGITEKRAQVCSAVRSSFAIGLTMRQPRSLRLSRSLLLERRGFIELNQSGPGICFCSEEG